jgi:DNA polymerase III gamma/tau subunit
MAGSKAEEERPSPVIQEASLPPVIEEEGPAPVIEKEGLTPVIEEEGASEGVVEEEEEEPPVEEEVEGRLGTLAQGVLPETRECLATGDARGVEKQKLQKVRAELRTILSQCAERVWIEESDLVGGLLEQIKVTAKESRRMGFIREHPGDDIEQLLARRETVCEEEKAALEQLREDLTMALAEVTESYNREADALDQKYQNPELLQKLAKPSRDLLELRTITQRLLKQNRAAEAAAYSAEIALLEKVESRRAEALIQKRYQMEGHALKTKYAARKEVTCKKFRAAMDEQEKMSAAELEKIDKMIAKIRAQFAIPEETRRTESKATTRPPTRNTQSPRVVKDRRDFAATGRLTVTPPQPIARDKDIGEIRHSALEEPSLGTRRSPRRVTPLKATPRK